MFRHQLGCAVVPDHQTLQYAFAAHLRSPDECPAPADIEDRRMAIYRRLFFNNIEAFLSQAFPVLREVLQPQTWQDLVRRFYARHQCKRPQFYQLAEEFVEYLQAGGDQGLPPFASELAHYEWVELALSVAPGEWPQFDCLEQVGLRSKLVLSPFLELLCYRWPVQQISQDFQPEQAPQQLSCLMVFRGLDENVVFKQLNPLTLRLLELIQQLDAPLAEVLAHLASEAGVDAKTLQQPALQTVESLLIDGAVLGEKA